MNSWNQLLTLALLTFSVLLPPALAQQGFTGPDDGSAGGASGPWTDASTQLPADGQAAGGYGSYQNQGQAPVSGAPLAQMPYSQPQENAGPHGPYWHDHNNRNQNGQRPYSAPPGGYTRQQSYGAPGPSQSVTGYRPSGLYIPSGLVLPVTLDTTISLSTIKPGDYVQAHISQNVPLGGTGYIPGGTVIQGEIKKDDGGRLFDKSAGYGAVFSQLKLPNGTLYPIQAHLVGKIDNYINREDVTNGEGAGQKIAQFFMHSGIGAGLGGIVGGAEGAIGSGGRGFSSGTWMGAGVGSGAAGLSSFAWRHRSPVLIHSGQQMQMQMDSEVTAGPPQNSQGY